MLASHQYANALLSLPDHDWEVFLQNLNTVCHTKEMQSVIKNPFVPENTLHQLICACFPKANQAESNFIDLLVTNQRLNIVEEILSTYREKKRVENKQVLATITTAYTASAKQKEGIERYVSHLIEEDQKLVCEYRVNQEIIGGFIVDIEGKTIDRSVTHHLSKIKLSIEGS
jgi:ATP synthase F1 delta subunit